MMKIVEDTETGRLWLGDTETGQLTFVGWDRGDGALMGADDAEPVRVEDWGVEAAARPSLCDPAGSVRDFEAERLHELSWGEGAWL